MNIIWVLTCLLLFVLSGLTANWVLEQYKTLSSQLDLAQQEAQMRKIVDPLKKQPQSGLMINCPDHGVVPITQSEYDKQVAKAECRCPICGAIPRRIWNDPKVVNDKR